MTKEQYLLTIEYIARLLLSLQNVSEAPCLPDGITLENVYQLSSIHLLSAATYTALAKTIKSSDIHEEYLSKWEREAELAVVQHVRQAVAFGDSDVDVDMLQYCGLGVAMGNAPRQVKEAADYVTASNDQEGVYIALNGLRLKAPGAGRNAARVRQAQVSL